jgi:hypothetical protein
MAPCRFQPHGENDEVERFGNHFTFFGLIMDGEIVSLWILFYMGDAGADIANSVILFCPLNVFIEILPVSPHIHIENGGLDLRSMFLRNDRFLGGVHAANGRAVPLTDMGIS